MGRQADDVIDFERAPDGRIVLGLVDPTAQPKRFEKLRGYAGKGPSTDEIMALMRGEGLCGETRPEERARRGRARRMDASFLLGALQNNGRAWQTVRPNFASLLRDRSLKCRRRRRSAVGA